jgi:transcriptional regulator GlxA family with amidase domain
MRLARNLLANTSMRIGEIAAETGFNDMFHFSRIFKKRFGKSPVAYRKKYGL